MSATAASVLPERGSTLPRLFTAPLATGASGACGCGCAHTESTTYGFRVARFAEHVLKIPLDPWQRWLVIHAGELLPDGRPRFKKVLVIVARQNGKTHLLKVLALYWMFVEQWAMLLGQSTTLSTAKESWEGAQEVAWSIPELAAEFGTVRKDNNDPHWKAAGGSKYRIAASTRKGGRGLPVDRLIIDELREQQTWVAYNAAMPTMNARPFGQAWLITNQGDDQSVVLNSLRKSFLAVVEGEGDDLSEDLGGFEWSAKEGADPRDPLAIASANPNVGHRLSMRSLLADARRAMQNGGEEETGFRTEILCQRVHALDAAVDPEHWKACKADGATAPDLMAMRSRLAFCLDVAPDNRHVTLAAAVLLPDGRVWTELVDSWNGTTAAKAALPGLLGRARPRALGWFPAGPAASLAATLAERRAQGGAAAWPPPGVKVEEIRGEVAAVCMGFSELVSSEGVAHLGEDLANAHVLAAAKLWKGDSWRFARKGEGHCDAAYAMAGAVHLARTMPAGPGKPRLVFAAK